MGYLGRYEVSLVLLGDIVTTDRATFIFIGLHSFSCLSVLKPISPIFPCPLPEPLANFYNKHDSPGECRKGLDSVICQIAARDGACFAVFNQRIGRNELAQRMC